MAERASGEIPQHGVLHGYLAHIWYTVVHKIFVGQECWRYGLWWQGIVHDASKFRWDELKGYTEHHFLKRTSKEEFEKIRCLHAGRNPHHYEYWTYYSYVWREIVATAMPDRYRKEMLADWRGAAKAKGFGGEDAVRFYYLVNRDTIILHPETRAWVEKELNIQ